MKSLMSFRRKPESSVFSLASLMDSGLRRNDELFTGAL
jgi:hypothetical protein